MSINYYQRIVFVLLFCGFIVVGPPSFSKDQEQPSAEEGSAASTEKTSYVYDLRALIEKSRGNIKRVNEKIKEQAIAKRNLQREEKAREYYDRAMALFDEGKISEARDYFEKSIRITEHPEMKDYIKVSEKKFKSQAQAMRRQEKGRIALTVEQEKQQQEQVRNSYQDGERFYKAKNYKAARDEFTLVEQLIPEYKATRSYLKLLEEKIAAQDQVDLINQKKEIVRQQKEADDSRIKEKEQWYKELELREQERQRKLQEQAKKVYAEALSLYKEKNFISAKEKFQEVEWVVPDYRSTRRYLEQIDKDIKDKEIKFTEKEKENRARQDWDDELTRKKAQEQAKKDFEKKSSDERHLAAQEAAVHYQKATDLLGQKKYTEARDEFLAVQKVYPEFKGTETYLARLNNELGIVETAPAKVADLVRGIYANALADFNRKDFGAAKLKFEQVEFMYPDYMATRKYLDKLSKQLDKQVIEVSQEEIVADAKAHSATIKPGPEVDKEGYQALLDKAEPFYVSAVGLFEEKKFDEALKQFKTIEEMIPNYKATRAYLKRVENQIKRVEQQRYKEEQTKQAETINLLAKQANVLYAKILLLAADRTTSDAQKKFAMVDKLFTNMSKEQARLLKEIAEEEEKLRLEEIAYEQEVQRSEFTNAIDPIYQEAVRLYKEQKYDEAKAKFLEAQSKIADYRSSKRYLNLIEKQNELLQQTIKDRENQIAQFKDKVAESAEMAAQLQLQAQERAMIKDLLAQAAAINDEIVVLAKDKNFEAIKEKFAQLEKIVDSLLTIKSEAVAREEREKAPSRKSRLEKGNGHSSETTADKKEGSPASPEKPENKDVPKADSSITPAIGSDAKDQEMLDKETRNHASKDRAQYEASLQERKRAQAQAADQQIKMRQAAKESQAAYNRALKFFHAKNYPDARAQFLNLQNDPKYGRSALTYIEKIDQAVLDQQTQLISRQEKQRDRYLEERAERERMSFHVNEASRYNQIQSSPRSVASVPSVVSVPHYTSPRQQYLTSLNLRGKNPPIVEITDQNQVSQMKAPDASVSQAVVASTPAVEPPNSEGVSPNENGSWIERRRQKRLSDRRKKYIEEKEKEKQKAEEVQKKKEEQAKAEAVRKVTANRNKAEGLNKKTTERQMVEKEARLQKIREIEAKARFQNENLRQAKAASDFGTRQVVQEQKLRTMYEQELRGAKSSGGFDKALVALQKEKREESRQEVERQKKFLRDQREEDKTMREEKIRKIDTIINQSQKSDFSLSPDQSHASGSETEAKYTVKVLSNNDVSPAQLKSELAQKDSAGNPSAQQQPEENKTQERKLKEENREEKKVNEKLLREKRLQERLLKDKELHEKKIKDKLVRANELREKWLEQKNVNQKLLQEKRVQENLIKEKELQEKKIEEGKITDRLLHERTLRKKELQDRMVEEQKLNEKLLQEKILQQKLLQEKNIQERKLQEKLLQEKQLQQKQEQEKQQQEKQRQKQDSAKREADRRKFEDGLGRMYSEAMGYYRQHMYKEARDRFDDVEEISPNYKKTRAYLSKIKNDISIEQKRQEKLGEKSSVDAVQKVASPVLPADSTLSPEPVDNHGDAVSQALDDFESKSK